MSKLIDALLDQQVTSLADIGEGALWSELDDVATSPALPIAVELIARAWPVQQPDQALALLDAGLERSTSPLAFTQTLDVAIGTSPAFLDAATDTIRRRCASRAAVRNDPMTAYYASAATTALTRLAVRGHEPSRHNLLSTLMDVTVDDDATFRTTGARCSGIAYEHFHTDALLPVLQRLADGDEADSEAAKQLGLVSLVQAFDGTVAEAQSALQRAAGWFDQALGDDDRTDAALYLPVVQALIGILERDDDVVATATEQIPSAAVARAMWDDGADRYEWSRPRRTAEGEWATLVTTVHAARAALASDAWLLNAASTLTALADAYKASRSVTLDDSTSGGIVRFVEPAIDAVLIRRQELATYLDQALASGSIEIDAEFGAELRNRLRVAAEDPPGIRDGGDGTVLGTLIDLPPVTAEDQSALDAIEQLIADRLADGPPDPLFDCVFSTVVDELKETAAFPQGARDKFLTVLLHVLRFVEWRMQITPSQMPNRTAYLWKPVPLEKEMVQDLAEYLSGSRLHAAVKLEVPNIGSGRVDLLVHWDGWTVIVEGKRSATYVDQAVAHELVAGQALAYQAVNMSVTIALILDHSTPPTGVARAFASCVWVDTVVDDAGSARQVVNVVLPGARTSPSAAPTPTGASPTPA